MKINVMDKIWDRKSFKVGGHWPLWWGWKNEWPRRTLKKEIIKKPVHYVVPDTMLGWTKRKSTGEVISETKKPNELILLWNDKKQHLLYKMAVESN